MAISSQRFLATHGRLWYDDSFYRLSWVLGPQCLAVVALCWIFGTQGPKSAPWGHPSDPASAPLNTPSVPSSSKTTGKNVDFATCYNDQIINSQRVAGCTRAIDQGALTAAELSQAYYARGFYRCEALEYAAALADLKEAVRRDPSNSFPLHYRAKAQLGLGHYDLALADVDASLGIKDWAPSHALRAQILSNFPGRAAEAMAAADQATALDAKLLWPYQTRAQLFATAGKWDKVVDQATAGLGFVPSDISLLRQRARAYLENKNLDLAIADYSDVIRRDAWGSADWNLRGIAWLRKGESSYDKALADFTQASLLDPKDPLPLANRAIIYKERAQEGAAIADLLKAIALNEKNADYHARLGRIYQNQKKYSDAELSYSRSIELEPSVADHWFGRGFARLEIAFARLDYCQSDEARREIERQSRAGIIGGNPCARPTDLQPPLDDLNKSVQLNPKLEYTHYNIGRLLQRLGQFDKAMQAFSEAHALDPRTGDGLVEIGYILETNLHNEQGALQKYNEAIQANPRNFLAYNNRGAILGRHKSTRNQAISDYRQAIAINPNYELAKENLRQLGVRP